MSIAGTALRFVDKDFCRRRTHFEVTAHFLDLRGLLFELRCQNLHSFLLLGEGPMQEIWELLF
jgi:hypothetical protein